MSRMSPSVIRGLLARVPVEGRLPIEIAAVLRGEIVEFSRPVVPRRVPLLRRRVALGVEAHDVLEPVEYAVVKVRRA